MKYRIIVQNGKYRIQYRARFFGEWEWVTHSKYRSMPLSFSSFDEAVGEVHKRQEARAKYINDRKAVYRSGKK